MSSNIDEKIVLGLDIPKSKAAITKDLKKVMKDIPTQKIKLNTDTSELTKSVQKAMKNLQIGGTASVEFQEVQSNLKEINTEMQETEKLNNSVGNSLSAAAKKLTDWGFTSGVVGKLILTLKEMPKAVYDIDTAITQLYKVTDDSDTKYQKILTNTFEKSKDLGTSVSGLIEQIASWAKLGYTIDDSTKLAETSSIYSNIGKVDHNTAISDITTAMKAFNIEAENSLTIVDSLNALNNKFGTSSKDLGTGLSIAASSLSAAGNDIDQSLAMITNMTKITQNADDAGNTLKSLAMHINGYDEEMQSYSNNIEQLGNKIADLTKTTQTPTGISIFTDATKENYKSTYQLLADIASVWNEMSAYKQADLISILAGTENNNSISELLGRFQSGQVQKAYEISANSNGSAMQEQEDWLTSLEGKIAQFNTAFQLLSATVLDSDLLKFFVDLGTIGVSGLESIASGINNINSLFGILDTSSAGTIGALSGLAMNQLGIGECTNSSGILYCAHPLKIA